MFLGYVDEPCSGQEIIPALSLFGAAIEIGFSLDDELLTDPGPIFRRFGALETAHGHYVFHEGYTAGYEDAIGAAVHTIGARILEMENDDE